MGKAMTNRLLAGSPAVCLEGYLLVAAPSWQDASFERSVCMIVHHSGRGAVGVFLNRSLNIEAPALWQHLSGTSEQDQNAVLQFGGSNAGPVVALHNCQSLAEFTSAEGVYFAAQIDHLQELVKVHRGHCDVKIIVGQTQWSSGALDQEFSEGKWLPLPVSSKLVFLDKASMWGQAMREIGNQFVVDITGCRTPPTRIMDN